MDFENVTVDVDSIVARGDRKIVEMTATYPSVSEMNIMGRVIKTRARARALIATGVVNTTVANVKSWDIQRFTKVESFEEVSRSRGSAEANVVVIVEK